MSYKCVNRNNSQSEGSVIVISDDEDNKDKSRSKESGLDSGGSLFNNAHNASVTEETETNTITLLSKSMASILSFFQQWRSNDYVRAPTNSSEPDIQRPNTSRCVKPSSLRSTPRFTPYEKTIRRDVLGKVSADEMVLILADVPRYYNSVKKFKVDKELYSEVNKYLNYRTPTMKQMCLILLNLYQTSVKKKTLTLEQETFVFVLINRILNFLESLMLIPGEGSIVPFKPPPDFRDKHVTERLPDYFYGDLKTLNLYGFDISRYELFKIIRHFDQVAVTTAREKAEKYLLNTGLQPKIPMKRTYEDALIEATRREAERRKYEATSCKIEAEKEFAAARERQAEVDKKVIPKEPTTVNKATRSSPTVVNTKDKRSSDKNDFIAIERANTASSSRSTQDIISQTRPTSPAPRSSHRNVSPNIRDTYNNRPRTRQSCPRVRPDCTPVLDSRLANSVIFGDRHPIIQHEIERSLRRPNPPVIRNENESSSSRISIPPFIRNENESSTRHPHQPTDSRTSRRPLLQSEEERERFEIFERFERRRTIQSHRYY